MQHNWLSQQPGNAKKKKRLKIINPYTDSSKVQGKIGYSNVKLGVNSLKSYNLVFNQNKGL